MDVCRGWCRYGLALTFGLMLCSGSRLVVVQAQAPLGLDTIIRRGKILVGMDMSAPPFAYVDQKRQPAGSEVEVANLLAKDLGVALEIVPTSAANRVPYLVTGRVDVMMGAFSIFPDRAKAVWFSSPYGSAVSVILAPAGTRITALGDLAGKRIAVSRGTYTEQVLAAAAPKASRIMRFDDDAQAMAAVANACASASAAIIARARCAARLKPLTWSRRPRRVRALPRSARSRRVRRVRAQVSPAA